MLKNEEIFDLFKKSITSTIKSIGKTEDLEIEFSESTSNLKGNKMSFFDMQLCFRIVYLTLSATFIFP